jgi:hypothetical protein
VPKMFLHAPQGAFTAEARARVAAELTELGMACERLIDTPQIRAGIWVYFVEHAPDTVFRAGRQAAEPIMSLKVYALKGGFNAETKTRMVTEATAILGKCSKTDRGQVPAYVGILEVPKRTGACMASRFTWRRCRPRRDLSETSRTSRATEFPHTCKRRRLSGPYRCPSGLGRPARSRHRHAQSSARPRAP